MVKLLKFEAEGQEFAKFLRSLEQFDQTVKGQNNFYQNSNWKYPGKIRKKNNHDIKKSVSPL